MNDSRTTKVTIRNPLLALYLIYIVFIVNIEWINFITQQIGLELSFGIAEGISASILIVFLYFKRNSFSLKKLKVNAEVIIGAFLILGYGGVMSVYPDTGIDTFNYHLIAQNPRFINYFVEDYGYGNLQAWIFRLADRLFYYFRYFLGFRYGTILNTFILVVCFTQIYSLLDEILREVNEKLSLSHKVFCNRLLWSMVILFSLDTMLMFGNYHSDVFALPLGLEMLRILIKGPDLHPSAGDIAYFALLNGLSFAFKLTNIIYIVPCVLAYIILHYKSIRAKDWFTAIGLGLYPSAMYLSYNWINTGSPFFPFYNAIFQSPYYPIVNYGDPRWGGANLFEKLFWIIYTAFKPSYRQCEISDLRPAVLIVGLIGTLGLIIIFFTQRIRKKETIPVKYILLISLAISFTLLWSFSIGYGRYFIFGKVLWGILAFCFVMEMVNRYKVWGKIIASISAIFTIVCFGMNLQSSLAGRNWSWTEFHRGTFKEQLHHVLRDRDTAVDYNVDADLFVLTDLEMMGVAELIDSDVYTINTTYPEIAAIDYETLFDQRLSQAEHAYDLHKRTFTDIYEYVESVSENNLFITGMSPIALGIGNYEMVAVVKKENGTNTLWTSDEGQLEVGLSGLTGDVTLSFIGGRCYDWELADIITLKIYFYDGSSEREVASVILDNVTIDNYDISVQVKDTDTALYVRAFYSNEEPVCVEDVNKVFIINAVIA